MSEIDQEQHVSGPSGATIGERQPEAPQTSSAPSMLGGVEGRIGRTALQRKLAQRSVQRRANAEAAEGEAGVHAAAERGTEGAGHALPHIDKIQESFGRHDIRGIEAHTGGAASAAAKSIGAEAYATGNHVAFAGGTPSLHTAAHEAAHIVQQKAGVHLKGGVGQEGDTYERHADAVADRVVAGQSAESLLDAHAGPAAARGSDVQRKAVQFAYAKGGAAKDAELFEKASPIPSEEITPLPPAAARLGIHSTNLDHYLERHTYKYQKLNSKTISPAATLFPVATSAADVKGWVIEAIGKVKDTETIGSSPVSVAVDLANGMKVNLGALKNNQLAAFFPLSGSGVHQYSADELKAIRDEKNKVV